MTPDETQQLLEMNILEAVGLQDADPAIQQRVLSEANNQILAAVIKRVEARLTPEDAREFERLFATEDDTPTDEDMAFLKRHSPDLDELMIEEALIFKKGAVDAIREMSERASDEKQKIKDILNGLGK